MLRKAVAVCNTMVGPVRDPRVRRVEEAAGVAVTAAAETMAAVVLPAAAGTVVAAEAVCTVAAAVVVAVTPQVEPAERTGVNL